MTPSVTDQVENGRGFAVVRGVPVIYESDFDRLKHVLGLGTEYGYADKPKCGDLICEVTDMGLDNKKANAQGYISNSPTSWHCDNCCW